MAKKLLAFLLVFCLAIPTGCWNRRDPELLAIVLATAFDFDEAKNMHLVIVQIANPVVMGGGGGDSIGDGGKKRSFWVLSAYGHTPFEAMRNLTLGSSRELFWAHNRVILFSEKTARRGIREIMDVIERERQIRTTARPTVVHGDIRTLMEADFPLEETGARGLDRQMVTIQFEKSVFYTMFINELYSAFEAPGQEVFLGKTKVLAGGEDTEGGGNAGGGGGESGGGSAPPPPPPAQIGGGALFKGDRFVGWATQDQARGWLLAMGRGRRFSFVAECPGHPGSYFSVEIFHATASMRPAADGGNLRVAIEVKATCRFQNYTCECDLDKDNPLVRSLERRAAQAVRNRIKDMIKRSQDLETDVMGFGNLFYRKEPGVWREIEDRWDEIFPTLPVDVQVEINIVRTGLVKDPLIIR